MEANRQRFDEAKFLGGERRGEEELLPGDGDEFGEGSVALDAQSFIELAGVGTETEAGGALAAGGVRRQRNGKSGDELAGNIRAGLDDFGGDFVAGDAGIRDEGFLPL